MPSSIPVASMAVRVSASGKVIRIVINNNGDYTVTQSRPIDHPNSSIETG